MFQEKQRIAKQSHKHDSDYSAVHHTKARILTADGSEGASFGLESAGARGKVGTTLEIRGEKRHS